MQLPCVKGERILLTDCCSQTFAGVVKSVNEDLGRILLTDIVQLPGNKSIPGYRNFDRHEIIEIRKLEVFDNGVQNVEDDLVCEGEQNQPEALAQKLSQSELKKVKKAQKEYRLIKSFGSDFRSAISSLRNCSTVGVYGKDASSGRFGRTSIMAISTPSSIFVFDLQALGDEAIHEGLREILESPKIVKVIHDCRLLSDCLKHKHLVHLENVRDVEAEDVLAVFQERRMIRKHSRSLHYLLNVYLGVEMQECQEKGEVWHQRPLAPNLLEDVVASASFLIPLQEAIERKFTQLLIDASNLYNRHLRDLEVFDHFYNDPQKTLRKEINELLAPSHKMAMLPPDPVYIFKGEMLEISCVAFKITDSVQRIYSGTLPGIVHVWDLKSKREVGNFKASDSTCLSVCIPEEEEVIITHSKSGEVSFWKESDNEWTLKKLVKIDFFGFCKCQIFGSFLYVPIKDSKCELISLERMETLQKLNLECEKLGDIMAFKVCLLNGRECMIVAYEVLSLGLWDLKESRRLSILQVEECLMAVDYDVPTNKGVCGGPGDKVIIFSLDRALEFKVVRSITLTNPGVAAVRIRPDGKLVAVGCWDGKLRLYSWKSFVLLAALDIHTSTVQDVSFCENYKENLKKKYLIAAGSQDCRISLWDLYN